MKCRFLFAPLLLVCNALMAQQFSDASNNLPTNATLPLTMDVAVLDVDADGDQDLILALEFKQNLILFNDGSGHFSVDSTRLFPLRTTYSQGAFVQGEDSEDVAVADFNNDSIPDLLFVSEDTPFHELLFGLGNAQFELAPSQIPKTLRSNAVLAHDFNGDGSVDVLVGHNGENQLYVNDGTGTFAPDTSNLFPTNYNYTQDLKLADIDGDNDLDVLEGCELGGSNIYLNNNGAYVEANDRLPSQMPNFETRKIVPADVNNDGYIDLFLCNVAWNTGVYPRSMLLINDGLGYFSDQSAVLFPYEEPFTLDAVFLDLNGDSLLDLVTAQDGDVFNPKTYLNNPSNPGQFTHTNELLPNLFQDNGIAIVAADFNGDHATDLYLGATPDRLLLQENSTTVQPIANAAGTPIRAYRDYDLQRIYIHGLPTENIEISLYNLAGQLLQTQQTTATSHATVLLREPQTIGPVIVCIRSAGGIALHRCRL